MDGIQESTFLKCLMTVGFVLNSNIGANILFSTDNVSISFSSFMTLLCLADSLLHPEQQFCPRAHAIGHCIMPLACNRRHLRAWHLCAVLGDGGLEALIMREYDVSCEFRLESFNVARPVSLLLFRRSMLSLSHNSKEDFHWASKICITFRIIIGQYTKAAMRS
jgi:hypothetical protein